MQLSRNSPRLASALAEWQWTATPRPEERADSAAAHRTRLAGALRAGHALGVSFEVRVDAAPTPSVALGCSDARAARWITRTLLPAYGRSRWTRRALEEQSSAVQEWGRRLHPWPDRLRDPADGVSAVHQLVLTTAAVPRGVRVRWQFSPCPATWTRTSVVQEGERFRSPREERMPPERRASRVEPTAMAAPSPRFWRARVAVEFPATVAIDPKLRRAVRSAVEGALRTERANGVRFAQPGLLFRWGRPWFPIAEEEMLSVLPDPNTEGLSPDDGGARLGPTLPIGRSGTGRVIGPSIESGQGRHLAVLGETGMGKSATLVAVAQKAATLGGVVLFDPLGETARSFVERLAPQEVRERLIWVSPQRGTPGINALEGIGRPEMDPVHADRRLSDLVYGLRRVRSGRYDAKYWGPRLEEMLTRALSAAAALPRGTLTDAHTLLATGGRTRQVVPPEAQEAVRALSDRVRERPEDADGARRLLYEVVRSPALRRMLCESEPSLHVAELVAPGRVAVISGDAAGVGESVARYLLAVYLALVWSELLARPSPSKTFVVLDEVQWFAHETLSEMLRLARRRNVHVVLATQTVASLPEEVEEAVWTNVSDFVAFRGSPQEARELARATTGVSVEELLSLPRGHAIALLGKGSSVAWLRTAGRPPASVTPSPERDQAPREPTAEAVAQKSSAGLEPGTAEHVLEWLREQAEASRGTGPLRVELAELRRAVDPVGRGVRDAGAILGRTGALLASVREPGGAVWTLDPARIPAPPAKPDGSAVSEAAEAPQPS